MYEKILNKYAIKQIAYVVEDLEQAAHDHAALFGSGPYVWMPTMTPAEATCNGAEVKLHLDEAYSHYGTVQIELIEIPKTGDKSIFNKPGFHHFAIWADDVDAALAEFAEAGCQVALVMKTDRGMPIYFIDCTEKWGHYIELYCPQTFLFDLTQKLTENWDGEDVFFDMQTAMGKTQ